ncbi:AHH domain-containing protein, partial [Bacillus pseudomycoides]|nr:AHH domain-containing protein [Bacillus pseudomycoides]
LGEYVPKFGRGPSLAMEGVGAVSGGGKNLLKDAYQYVKDTGEKDAKGASGAKTKPNQVHHYATNKSKTYTHQMEDITKKYGLDLDEVWNKELLPHQGRHPNAYHEFVLDELKNIDMIANGDNKIFLELFETNIKSVIRNNPDMLYSNYWKNLK